MDTSEIRRRKRKELSDFFDLIDLSDADQILEIFTKARVDLSLLKYLNQEDLEKLFKELDLSIGTRLKLMNHLTVSERRWGRIESGTNRVEFFSFFFFFFCCELGFQW